MSGETNSTSSCSGAEVVASGKDPRFMQFPSPVYFVRWIDERHAVIGAGGGGRRFGMANLLAIIAVDTSPRQPTHPFHDKQIQQRHNNNNNNNNNNSNNNNNNSNSSSSSNNKRHEHGEGELPMEPWRFVAAVEMGENIPWCASSFLPCIDEIQLSQGVVGYIAVSHVTCFTFVEVRRPFEGNGLFLRCLACVALPSDPKNPDKKPIALVQGAVVVAHDEGGVHIYSLRSFLETPTNSLTDELDTSPIATREESSTRDDTTNTCEDQNKQTSKQQDTTAAASPQLTGKGIKPIASWALPARVNDLHANRFFVPKKLGNHSGKTRHWYHSDYLIIAALVQDKTLRLCTMKLRRNYHKSATSYGNKMIDKNSRNEKEYCNTILEDACVFTGKDCRIPFSLMKSSMRLVQLFGVEDVSPSLVDATWKKSRSLHCKEGSRGAMPIASLVVVVYDVMGNQSYMLTAQVLSTTAICDNQFLSVSTPPISDSSRAISPIIASEMGSCGGATSHTSGNRGFKKLALRVLFSSQPSPLVKEGVTTICPCHYQRCGSADSAAVTVMRGQGVGTVVPSYWLAGTVEGTILSILHSDDDNFQVLSMRPSKNKYEAKQFSALHREPVSCVAVSPINDVLTSDIAQNVVVSVLPFWERLPIRLLQSSTKSGVSHGLSGVQNQKENSMTSFIPANCTLDGTTNRAMIVTSSANGVVSMGEEFSIRPKCMDLSLFPYKEKSYKLFLYWNITLQKIQLIMAVVVLPLIAILLAYWLL
ncbi:uncharacterized protein TM35_000092670 [Trypanosoma theileri]|uniref:Uncharacterized protein n=1 Tax=Trypanosoma theileri TaxID=67003 RepID=A0A1X0NZU7_9TRYP|nr:uncharacterized protein TM35_000092670 [Trypanosoma theileri]ORC90217.1 hypothetical protein TM35_000092670 [Trypanosoma theileri]